MTGALLAIDAGGTHTRAVIQSGARRSPVVEAGPANWTTLGPERSARAIGEAAGRALEAAGLSAGALSGAGIALAGYYPPWHEAEAHAAIEDTLPGVPVRLVPDLIAAWAGATGGEPGIVLAAGTGAVAYGQDAGGRSARAGGWGPLFGDEGGGYWIGTEALRAVARALDRRGPATSLSNAILTSTDPPPFGLSTLATHCVGTRPTSWVPEPSTDPEPALRAVYRDGWSRERVAALSVDVARAAGAGDAAAAAIMERAAAELGALILGVARRLEWGSGPIPVFAVGGLLKAEEPLRAPLERWLDAVLPSARWKPPLGPPIEGALRLAREAACPTS